MTEDQERPPVYRHEMPRSAALPALDIPLREAIEDHLASFMPTRSGRWAELISDSLNLDVLTFPATEERPIHTLVTLGMSEAPMNTPPDASHLRRCELVLNIPTEWAVPMDDEEAGRLFEDPAVYWPWRFIKQIARVPAMFDTWVCWGHSLSAGPDPRDTYEGTDFSGVLIGPAATFPADTELRHGEETIHFWGLYPLYADEVRYKLEVGSEAVIDGILEAGYVDGYWPGRPSIAPQKKRTMFSRFTGR